jgi:hypothetical protein
MFSLFVEAVTIVSRVLIRSTDPVAFCGADEQAVNAKLEMTNNTRNFDDISIFDSIHQF